MNGEYSMPGSSRCSPCLAGSYSTVPSSSTCTQCSPGTYLPAGSLTVCASTFNTTTLIVAYWRGYYYVLCE